MSFNPPRVRGKRPKTAMSEGVCVPTSSATSTERQHQRSPVAAGVFFGLGLGGFFDGILLHQVLQWHHMLSSVHPTDTVDGLSFNTLWDGLFHGATYVFVLVGLILLWRRAHRPHFRWTARTFIGTLLVGFGLFNLVEGVIDHQILGIHHVNETVPLEQQLYWDIGFLLWGAVMLVVGLLICRRGEPNRSAGVSNR